MKYNKTQDDLQKYISFYERDGVTSIEWDNYYALEKVYKNNYLIAQLKDIADYLHKWSHDIGKQVYKANNDFNYTVVDTFSDLDGLNQRHFNIKESVIFTEELFNNLCIDYIQYQINRLSKELIEMSITSNSTSKISNLVFEWQLECKQELIRIFKRICK